jgi:hypothetical protein
MREHFQELPVDASQPGGRMHYRVVLGNEKWGRFRGHALISVCTLLLCSGIGALAQSTAPALANPPLSIQATHLLGFPNSKSNGKGMLTIQDNVLRFEQEGKIVEQVEISSVRDVFLGEESVQVGGLPIKIGKTAAPFGGGRVVSLFAHAKYDTLTLEYVDRHGGLHGAIFQLKKGQGELVRNGLVTRGVYSGRGEEQAAKQSTSEVMHEDK